MKVILKESVKSLGNVGDIVNVSAGHARNFLLPNGFAVVADESNKAQLDHMNKVLAKAKAEQKKDAEAVASKINGLNIELIKRTGPGGKLFGSVTTQELALELGKKDIDVARRALVLEEPIKALGSFKVKANLFEGVDASFDVTVKVDPKQEEEMKKKQEELAAAKKLQQEMAAKEKEEGGETSSELSEEEKLKMEANKILRS
jgi:large subunit ribosomal protein L9